MEKKKVTIEVSRIIVSVLAVLFLTAAVHYNTTGQEINTDAHFSQGLDYANKGMFDEAIAEFNEVLKVNPGEALAYYNRGLAYQNKGQYDRAISDYNKAIEIDPGDAKVYYSKAYACERTNNKKRQQRHIRHSSNMPCRNTPKILSMQGRG